MTETRSDLTVLYFQRRTHRAGAQVCLCQFVPHLSGFGIRPLVVTEGPGFVTDYLSARGVPVMTAKFPPWRSPLGWHAARPFFFRRLKRFLEQHAPGGIQVVHGNDVEEGGVVVTAARMFGSPCVLHIRDQAADRERVEKYRGMEAHGIVVLSRAKYEEAVLWPGVKALTRIPDCIDPHYYRFGEPNTGENAGEVSDEFFSPSGSKAGRGPATGGTVLIVGSTAPLKGWNVAARAVVLLGSGAANRLWLFLGRADEERVRELQQILAAAETDIDYAFLGHRDEVERFYREADLVVMPSLQESFSRVIIEAGWFGKPLVSSRVGVAGEMIGRDEAGYLCEPGDVHDLAKTLVRALNDPDRFRRAAVLRERVDACCSVTAHNAALRSFYDKVRVTGRT